MQTIHSVVEASHQHTIGCSCLKAWTKFQASGQFTNYIKKVQHSVEAELQQGVFNDVNEIGTSKKSASQKRIAAKAPAGWENTVKHMKQHKEITNPYALAWYQKDKGDTPHK